MSRVDKLFVGSRNGICVAVYIDRGEVTGGFLVHDVDPFGGVAWPLWVTSSTAQNSYEIETYRGLPGKTVFKSYRLKIQFIATDIAECVLEPEGHQDPVFDGLLMYVRHVSGRPDTQ